MKLEITIGNQQLMFLVVFVAAMVIVGIAGAFNPGGTGGTPSVMGHSVDELNLTPLFISSGNVGIGTANPQAKLHIGGTAGTDGIMFPDQTLQTSAVVAVQAVGTTDIADPAAEADMPNMSITFNTGKNILVMFSAPFWAAVAGSSGWLKIYVDGVEIRKDLVGISTWYDTAGFQHLVTGLTPGSHTIKIRWQHNGGDLRQRGSTDGARVLTVVNMG